ADSLVWEFPSTKPSVMRAAFAMAVFSFRYIRTARIGPRRQRRSWKIRAQRTSLPLANPERISQRAIGPCHAPGLTTKQRNQGAHRAGEHLLFCASIAVWNSSFDTPSWTAVIRRLANLRASSRASRVVLGVFLASRFQEHL